MARTQPEHGDQFYVTNRWRTAGSSFTPYDPDFEKTMEIADEVMKNTAIPLPTLAK